MILDGKKLREKILNELKEKICKKDLRIKLAIILVGNNEASKVYIRNKEKACLEVGIDVIKYEMPESTSEEEVCNLINALNNNPSITGIILQSPVPKGIDFDRCSALIDSKKDVDGFTKDNIYNLYLNKETILPCTVKGILRLLEEYKIPIAGSNVVIVGRGNIVGKPLGLAMLNKDATVTWIHSKTKDIASITKNADILVVAAGSPRLITADMVKEGATVIDVGTSWVDGKLIGDVDYEEVSKKVSFITPNPGGVGPMTVAMIMDNLVEMESRSKDNG